MKVLLAISLIIAACLPAVSARAESGGSCEGDAVIAGMIMGHRQRSGYDINEMMMRLGTDPVLREVILDAYSQPLMQTRETRQLMIDEFVNKWSLACHKNGPMQIGKSG